MKRVFLVVLSVLLLSTAAFAEFKVDEKPVWGLYSGTAYTLQGGEWNLDLYGGITYGIGGFLEIGTNIWMWLPQYVNAYAKINVLPEGDVIPALSVGGSYGQIGGDNAFRRYTIETYLSKTISKGVWLSASYNYAGSEFTGAGSDFWNYLTDTIFGSRYKSAVGLDVVGDFSESARGTLEATVNLGSQVNFDLGGGVEFAIGDAFRIKVGLTAFIRENSGYLPFIDFHWRLK